MITRIDEHIESAERELVARLQDLVGALEYQISLAREGETTRASEVVSRKLGDLFESEYRIHTLKWMKRDLIKHAEKDIL